MRSMAMFTWTRSDVGTQLPQEAKPGRGSRALRYILLSPFRFGWWMSSKVEKSTGILFTLIVGVGLLVGGFFLCSSFIGAILGIPMLLAGGFLTVRALY